MTSAAPITATRRCGLVLVVVELIPVLAALASAASGALFRPRRLDGVGELLQREPDAPLVGIDADDEQRELVADADDLVGPVDRPVRHLRDVEKAVHAGLELDERPEVREPHHLAVTRETIGKRWATVAHGSGWICLSPREIRLFSLSTLRICVSISWPFLRTFDGWRTRRVHDISETWTSPSTPGSSSTKAP